MSFSISDDFECKTIFQSGNRYLSNIFQESVLTNAEYAFSIINETKPQKLFSMNRNGLWALSLQTSCIETTSLNTSSICTQSFTLNGTIPFSISSKNLFVEIPLKVTRLIFDNFNEHEIPIENEIRVSFVENSPVLQIFKSETWNSFSSGPSFTNDIEQLQSKIDDFIHLQTEKENQKMTKFKLYQDKFEGLTFLQSKLSEKVQKLESSTDLLKTHTEQFHFSQIDLDNHIFDLNNCKQCSKNCDVSLQSRVRFKDLVIPTVLKSNPEIGSIYFDSIEKTILYYDGFEWEKIHKSPFTRKIVNPVQDDSYCLDYVTKESLCVHGTLTALDIVTSSLKLPKGIDELSIMDLKMSKNRIELGNISSDVQINGSYICLSSDDPRLEDADAKASITIRDADISFCIGDCVSLTIDKYGVECQTSFRTPNLKVSTVEPDPNLSNFYINSNFGLCYHDGSQWQNNSYFRKRGNAINCTDKCTFGLVDYVEENCIARFGGSVRFDGKLLCSDIYGEKLTIGPMFIQDDLITVNGILDVSKIIYSNTLQNDVVDGMVIMQDSYLCIGHDGSWKPVSSILPTAKEFPSNPVHGEIIVSENNMFVYMKDKFMKIVLEESDFS